MDPLERKVRCKRISRAGELRKQPPEGHEPNNTACACVFTRVGTGQLAPTHAGAGNAICGAKREKSKGASGAFSRTLTARQRPSHRRCACTNQYTHTLTNSLTYSLRPRGLKKEEIINYLVHAIAHGWRRPGGGGGGVHSHAGPGPGAGPGAALPRAPLPTARASLYWSRAIYTRDDNFHPHRPLSGGWVSSSHSQPGCWMRPERKTGFSSGAPSPFVCAWMCASVENAKNTHA